MGQHTAQAKKILAQMTTDEKITLQTGADMLRTAGVPRLGVPKIVMADGPTGLRRCENKKTIPAICFPTASALASSFDRELVFKVGRAIGDQCRANGVHVLLAPGVNIKRNPLCGRNFEYFSEDPCHAGQMGSAYIKGVQSAGVGACVKHFACNSTEPGRMSVNSVVDERALREIYLSAFETIVKETKPDCAMSAYNMLNGTYCAENAPLVDILKNEWGFGGMLMTDWWANNDRVAGIKARTDLEMPKGETENIKKALLCGELSEADLDECVLRILELTLKYKDNDIRPYNQEKQNILSEKAAAESAVLLKNDSEFLPLNKTEKITVIGEFAKKPHFQGGGSSHVLSIAPDSLCDVLDSENIPYEFSAGYSANSIKPDKKMESRAVALAQKGGKVVIIVGTREIDESEGYNRPSFSLPENQLRLIEKITAVNPSAAVVLQCGCAVGLPFKNKVPAILLSHLAGQRSGKALYDILYGAVNPSGRLSETYIADLFERPFEDEGMKRHIIYGESVYVGYRCYDKTQAAVNYPFGYGLSYTDFSYSDISLSKDTISKQDLIKIKFTVTNSGPFDGADVAFIFVAADSEGIFRPEKELKGFEKIYLKAGESKTVEITLPPRAFAFYDTESSSWQTDGGRYEILLARSAEEIIKRLPLTIEGEKISIDMRAKLSSYYDLSSGFKYNPIEFEKLYGAPLPQERSTGDPFNVNSMLCETDETRRGRKINALIALAAKATAKALPEFSYAAKYALPKSPIRGMTMTAPCFTPDMARDWTACLNGEKGKTFAGFLRKLYKNRKNKR